MFMSLIKTTNKLILGDKLVFLMEFISHSLIDWEQYNLFVF